MQLFFQVSYYLVLILQRKILLLNIQHLIDNNPTYIKTLKEIEYNQNLYLKEFESKESEFKINLKNRRFKINSQSR